MTGFDPGDPLGERFTDAVAGVLTAFLDVQDDLLDRISGRLAPLSRLARQICLGGKRLRPAFCFWGHAAVAGQPDDPGPLLRVAASLDLLHVSALVHDDVMDSSNTRRGMASAHRALEAEHAARRGRGEAEGFGRAGAILLGDLLLVWSQELFAAAGLSPEQAARARRQAQLMRTEVTCGQFLDLCAQTEPGADLEAQLALNDLVLEYKAARYSVTRPLLIGAVIAGADEATLAGLADFGSPLGRAFQLRDDLLGVFGDPDRTGKPAGDDLREGKRTALIIHTLETASIAEAAELEGCLGRPGLTPEEVDRARAIVAASGARARVEDAIERHHQAALAALDSVWAKEPGRRALVELASRSVHRDA